MALCAVPGQFIVPLERPQNDPPTPGSRFGPQTTAGEKIRKVKIISINLITSLIFLYYLLISLYL